MSWSFPPFSTHKKLVKIHNCLNEAWSFRIYSNRRVRWAERNENGGSAGLQYLGIEIGSLLHQSADRKPETIGQWKVVGAACDGRHDRRLVDGDRVRMMNVTQLAIANGAVVPFVRCEPGHHPHAQRNQHVGQQDKQPNFNGQRVHEWKQTCRRWLGNLNGLNQSVYMFHTIIS